MSQAVWSAPGKIFLLGEYAVLAGESALLAAIGPRFALSAQPFAQSVGSVFHLDSPAGKFSPGSLWQWLDPYSGSGGFGASTAQALLVEAVRGESGEPIDARWRRYKTFSSGSGADFIVQSVGGVIEWRAFPFQITDRSSALQRIRIRVLQASQKSGRKVQTHSHLSSLDPSRVSALAAALRPSLQSGLHAFAAGNASAFADSLGSYADVLASHDLEEGGARQERHALCRLPGVLGAKGAGALLSDALVVVVDPARFEPDAWRQGVAALGLMDRGELPANERGVVLE